MPRQQERPSRGGRPGPLKKSGSLRSLSPGSRRSSRRSPENDDVRLHHADDASALITHLDTVIQRRRLSDGLAEAPARESVHKSPEHATLEGVIERRRALDRAQSFDAVDADGDGVITRREFDQWRRRGPNERVAAGERRGTSSRHVLTLVRQRAAISLRLGQV